jgi:predicted metal-binding protein
MAADGLKGRVGAAWQNTLLICAKCSRRLDGGFGPKGRTPLAKALRKHLGLKKGRKASLGIVEVKCLGVCPRGAVTVVNGAAPGEWALVRAGAEMEAVATGLELAESAS